MPMSADYLPLRIERDVLFAEEAGSGGFSFYVSIKALEKIERDGPPWRFEDARLLTQAICSPVAVFEGLSRLGFDEGYCYVAKPPRRWSNNGAQEDSPEDEVFLVFVKKEYGLVVFDWQWRKVDPSDTDLPKNHGNDFRRWLWKR